MQNENAGTERPEKRSLPKGFWRVLTIAVLLGNVAMVLLLWIGVPTHFAVPAPTLAVGIAGMIIESRMRRARQNEDHAE